MLNVFKKNDNILIKNNQIYKLIHKAVYLLAKPLFPIPKFICQAGHLNIMSTNIK